MNRAQVLKVLKVGIVATAIMLACEVIFSISAVNEFFCGIINNASGWVVYLAIWLIMFLQVTILNIPAYVVLSASVSVGIKILSIEYFCVVLSAYMCGCMLAYWLGWKFGKRAVKWCAGSEEDYEKWCNALNTKGKWWYFGTIVLPVFPDDLLCLVAGAVKFKFWLYCAFNFVGRGIGLLTIILVLGWLKTGDIPIMAIAWGVALIGEIIAYIVIKKKENRIK